MSDHLIAEANRHARALTIERDQIRTELALLREWQREVIQNANAHGAERRNAIARAERAEEQLALKNSQCERAERAAAGALVERDALAKDKARLNWLAVSDVWFDVPADKAFTPETFRAAIDAAMREGT